MAFIFKAVRGAGGWINAFRMTIRMNEVRLGSVVGKDEFGNQYFENKQYFFGRDRWVEYAAKDYDASQVPPEWHRWLHHMTDDPPNKVPPLPRKFYGQHKANVSGTDMEYVPYSTTTEKVSSWKPPVPPPE